MSHPELLAKISLILSQAKGTTLYGTAPAARMVTGPKLPNGIVPRVFLSGQATLMSEQVALLRTLYAQSTSEEKEAFPQVLRQYLIQFRPSLAAATAVGHVLADIHDIVDIDIGFSILDCVVDGWKQRLEHASETFSDGELTLLLRARSAIYARFPRTQRGGRYVVMTPADAHGLQGTLTTLQATVDVVRYERLKKQLVEGHNPEINADRNIVVSRLAALGFPKDVEAALREVDAKLLVADSPFDFKGCIDLVRTAFEQVVQHCAAAAARKGLKQPPGVGPVGNFQPLKQYLQNLGLLSENEAEAIQKFYNYLSTDGAHALGSAPEQARVSKNNVIEWSLLMLGRVQQFLA